MIENGQISVAASANKGFNGFNNAEQFKAVMDILLENCVSPDTIMASYNDRNGVIEVFADDCRFFADRNSGVFFVQTTDNAMTQTDLMAYRELDDCIDEVFEVMDEEPHYTEKDYNEAHQTEKWTDLTFAIASRIAKHFNDINLMDGLDITYDDDDDTLWVNNYQLFRSGRIRYWGDEEAEWPELAEYLSKQPSYWFDFVNGYYFDSDRI